MNVTRLHTTVESPIGPLLLVGDERSLSGLHMQAGTRPRRIHAGWRSAREPFAEARRQLGQYFAGERTTFDLPLEVEGPSFERRAWAALTGIGYGETATYGDIARRIGAPGEARAVGRAVGRNPIAIVLPCHRVIGADGSLTGFGGGLERKRFLLDHESGSMQLAV